MKALWARPQDEVTEEEYAEFYQHVSHDWQPTRWRRSGCRPRARSSTRRCCSCPATRRWTCSCARRKRGVQLYVKRVFIMDDCEALIPEYLRFVKGVVDAHDLSLNISREILQQDRQIQLIRKRLVKKVLSTVKDDAGPTSRRSTRRSGRSSAGRSRKACSSDHDNQDAILEICSFAVHPRRRRSRPRCATTSTRMKEGQDAIYYVTGESRVGAGELAAHGGVPRQGLRGAAAHRPGRRGVGRRGARRSRASRCASIAKGEVDLGGDDVDERRPKQGFAAAARPGWPRRWPRTSRRCGSRTG